jgi:hypothetical protein
VVTDDKDDYYMTAEQRRAVDRALARSVEKADFVGTDCGSIADEISDVARELRNGIATGEAGGRGVIAALGRLDSMAARVRGMECRSVSLTEREDRGTTMDCYRYRDCEDVGFELRVPRGGSHLSVLMVEDDHADEWPVHLGDVIHAMRCAGWYVARAKNTEQESVREGGES